jgi:hypothetical protein
MALDEATEKLLDAAFGAARADVPTDGEIGNLARRLSSVLPAGAGLATSPRPVSAPPPPPPAIATPGLLLKLGAVCVVAAGLGGWWMRGRTHAVPSAPPAARAASAPIDAPLAAEPIARESAQEPPPAGARREEVAARPVGVAAPVRRPAPRTGVDLAAPAPHGKEQLDRAAPPAEAPAVESGPKVPPTDAELAMLLEARRLAAADPERALGLLSEHRRQYPHSELVQERELIAIDALIGLGRDADARARADQFRRRFPGSAHLGRLRALEARIGR